MRVLLAAFAVLTALASARSSSWPRPPTDLRLDHPAAADRRLHRRRLRRRVPARRAVPAGRPGRTSGSPVLTIFVFVVLTLVGHADAPRPAALRRGVRRPRVAGQGARPGSGSAVYVVVPVAMLVLIVAAGARARASTRPPRHPVPAVAARRARPSSRRCCSPSASLLFVGPGDGGHAVAVAADAVHRPGDRRLAARLRAGHGAGRGRRRPRPAADGDDRLHRLRRRWCWSRCCASPARWPGGDPAAWLFLAMTVAVVAHRRGRLAAAPQARGSSA